MQEVRIHCLHNGGNSSKDGVVRLRIRVPRVLSVVACCVMRLSWVSVVSRRALNAKHLTGRETREETEPYFQWWIWEAPCEKEAVDGCTMVMKTTHGMGALSSLAKIRFNTDRIASDEIGGEPPGSLSSLDYPGTRIKFHHPRPCQQCLMRNTYRQIEKSQQTS